MKWHRMDLKVTEENWKDRFIGRQNFQVPEVQWKKKSSPIKTQFLQALTQRASIL